MLTPDQNTASLELLFHISRELASDLDLHTVLLRVLQLSMESVEAISGSIIVLDDEQNPVDSAIVYGKQIFNHTNTLLRSTLESGLAGWVMRNRESAVIPDTSSDPRWEKRPDDAPEQTGPKSAVGVPLLARDELVGVMTVVHPTPGTFHSEHGSLMRAISDLAGMAILNARLFEESRHQARVMSALAESASALTAALGTKDILQQVLEQTHVALQVEAVSLSMISPDRKTLTIKGATGHVAGQVLEIQLKVGEGVVGWVAEHGEALIVPDARSDPRFNPDVDRVTGFETRSIACAPIRYRGEVIGVLQALNPVEGTFGQDALFVLNGIGSLAGSVIRYGQLFDSLQSAHQSYQELFDDSIDPILITDWEGRVVQVNRRAGDMTGYSKDDLALISVFKLHDFNEPKFEGRFFSDLSAGKTITYESTLFGSSARHPVQVYVRQIRLDQVDYLQWIFRDITERKRLDTLRDDLLSMVYHDLRSPLANIIYSLDVMSDMVPEDETSMTLIEVARRSTERIKRLTSSLLDVQALESGKAITKKESVSPQSLIDTALEAVKQLATSKEQKLSQEVETGLPDLSVDLEMISRVLINLLENAVKFTPLGGEIQLGAKQVPEAVLLWVQDNGPGVPLDQRKAIFNKYSRLDSNVAGIGLGLFFCRLAVEAHNGHIWVDGEPGEGARFSLVLPYPAA
jgi:NtrC-family two-component system sensor histidine kinase KinB